MPNREGQATSSLSTISAPNLRAKDKHMEVGKYSVLPSFRQTEFSHSEKASGCPYPSRPTVLYSELNVLPNSDHRPPCSSLLPK